jgi:hypothetical protein
MIRHDPMELVPGVDSNFVQRYIMAYFYYATTANGPWLTCNPVVGNESEFCYLKLSGENEIAATRWLSPVHECQFAGVICNDKNHIVGLKLSKFPFLSWEYLCDMILDKPLTSLPNVKYVSHLQMVNSCRVISRLGLFISPFSSRSSFSWAIYPARLQKTLLEWITWSMLTLPTTSLVASYQ